MGVPPTSNKSAIMGTPVTPPTKRLGPVLVVLFYYSLFVLLMCGIVAATCLSAYFVTRRRSGLYLVIGFLFYFLDAAVVYQDDFVTNTGAMAEHSFWYVGHPVICAITGAGALGCIWLFVCERLDVRSHIARWCPIAFLLVSSLAFYYLIPNERWAEFLYFSMREVFLLLMFAYVLARRAGADDVMRTRLDRHRVTIAVGIILTLCTVAENVFLMLIFDPTTMDASVMWFFAERNISENLLYLWFGYNAVREAAEVLVLRFDAPPVGEREELAQAIDAKLPSFARAHDLSPREVEIARLILQGKDNQNIASELSLALSTVKVHVHNVLKKAGQANRQELAKAFWSE